MGKNTNHLLTALIIFNASILISCQRSIDAQAGVNEIGTKSNTSSARQGVTPYKFERINEHNFYSQGWKEQQVNIVGTTTIFSNTSDHVELVSGPDNASDPRLIQGCVTMNLPTAADPTLRRIRLRKGGYSGTLLRDLTELKYSTSVVYNVPTVLVLQVDLNNDDAIDFNIFFSPVPLWQGSGYPPVVLNTWQQWNALTGKWQIEGGSLPEFPDNKCTIQQLVSSPQYANARIIDTPPQGNRGEGIRLTIGGVAPHRTEHDNTIGYFDALIIGTKKEQHSTLYDFMCIQSGE